MQVKDAHKLLSVNENSLLSVTANVHALHAKHCAQHLRRTVSQFSFTPSPCDREMRPSGITCESSTSGSALPCPLLLPRVHKTTSENKNYYVNLVVLIYVFIMGAIFLSQDSDTFTTTTLEPSL